MKPRISAQDGKTRLFAHRGASATAKENTIGAFVLALELGADGLASEAWLTADGQAVLDRDGRVGGRFRRRRFGALDRASIPDHVPSIDDIYDVCVESTNLLLDIHDPDAMAPIVDAARNVGKGAEDRLWLRHDELEVLTEWRRDTAAKLVLRARLNAGESQERLANRLRERGVDALSLSHREWSGGLVTLLHRFDRYALATDLVHEREMAKLLDIGIDAISSPHVDRMIAVGAQFT
ncbi:MAG: glycerophosphodiester phosphodiesterase [Acidimicrobiales bacterium]